MSEAAPAKGLAAGTVPGLLHGQATERLDETAIRHKALGIWKEITWGEYLARVRAVALALHDAGLEAGQHACIAADNEPAWLFADLGIQSLGAASVAADPTLPPAEVADILTATDVRLVFCGDQEQVDKVRDVRDRLAHLERIVVFDMKGVAEYGDPMIESFADFEARGAKLDAESAADYEGFLQRRTPDEIAVVSFAADPTAGPRGALLTHRNQVATARAMAERADIGPKDTILSQMPLGFPATRVTDAYVPLVTGAVLNFPESIDTVAEDMVEIAPTVLLGVPAMYASVKEDSDQRMQRAARFKRLLYRSAMKRLRAAQDRRLAGEPKGTDRVSGWLARIAVGRWVLDRQGLLKVRYACSWGSTPDDLLRYFWALGVPLYQGYGQSETSGVAFTQKDAGDLGTAGWPLPTVEPRIDEANQELLLRGEGVFAGYHADPDATEGALVDGWYRTGETARLDDQGRLVLTDGVAARG